MDSNTTISIVGGSFSVAAVVVALVTWSLKRNVQHEDNWKKVTEARLGLLQSELDTLRQSLTNSSHKNELDSRDLANKLTTISGTIGELKGVAASLGSALENNRDKMSKFYREELSAAEERMRKEVEKLREDWVTKPRRR